MSERITEDRLDELILMAENADGLWSDESSRTALAGWRELKDLRLVAHAARDYLAASAEYDDPGPYYGPDDNEAVEKEFRRAEKALRAALGDEK